MTRIGVITDAHANLHATQAALSALDDLKCDRIVHLGDAIGIGPHPREVLELMLGRSDIVCLMGNHDELFAFDQLNNPPVSLYAGEVEHQRWTHAQLLPEWRERVREWPYVQDLRLDSASIRFQHYAVNDGGFAPISLENDPAELDEVFAPETHIVFFGHHHPKADVAGRARYINPGALGTNLNEGARYAVLDENPDGLVSITLHSATYDAEPVRLAMREREVPEAEFILRVFMGDS